MYFLLHKHQLFGWKYVWIFPGWMLWLQQLQRLDAVGVGKKYDSTNILLQLDRNKQHYSLYWRLDRQRATALDLQKGKWWNPSYKKQMLTCFDVPFCSVCFSTILNVTNGTFWLLHFCGKHEIKNKTKTNSICYWWLIRTVSLFGKIHLSLHILVIWIFACD